MFAMILAYDDTARVNDGEFKNLGTYHNKDRYHVYDAVTEARTASWAGNGTWKALRRPAMTFKAEINDSFLLEAISQSLQEIAEMMK